MYERSTIADGERVRPHIARFGRWPAALLGGGAEGNEELTAVTGVLLIVLLAVLGVTILRIRQLIWLHLFLGLLVLGPVFLKLASTGYRFVRYYTRNAIYVAKGPPELILRAIGPGVVLSTLAVFASGVVLMGVGPSGRSTPLLIHKASFIIWLVLTALHVLGHLPGLGHSLRAASLAPAGSGSASDSGTAGRWIAITGVVVAGAVLAIVLIPDYSIWTAPGAFPHHHH